jgi:hypothetical protein
MSFLGFVELACDVGYAGLIMESGIVGMALSLQQAFFAIADEGTHVVSFRTEEIELSLTARYFITLGLL